VIWEEALRRLYRLEWRGIKLDLVRVRECLRALGDPQQAFASVLVAGTNGKGSTASALASVLSLSGRRTALYTSPHLLDFRERIRIDGWMDDRELLHGRLERDWEIWERFELSFFEAATVLAFARFRDAGVEVAVLEVGLGGRLDATNTAEPILSVITSLGLDHAQILGRTAAAIAVEKAGIFRPGVPAVTDGGPPGAPTALAARAREVGACLYPRNRCVRVSGITPSAAAAGVRFRLAPRVGAPEGFTLPPDGLVLESALPGVHQAGNLTLAALAAAILRRRGFAITDGQIVEGIRRVRWPGRLERPLPGGALIADVAHNREGAHAVARHLAVVAPGREVRPVVGMVQGKDHDGFFRELGRVARSVWVVPLADQRAAPVETLAASAQAAGLDVQRVDSVAEALGAALNGAREPDGPLVLLCGSFHLLEEGYRELGLSALERLWAEGGDGASGDRASGEGSSGDGASGDGSSSNGAGDSRV
jgi:dihydrofolate synthase/folylpolyglutamate synthase